MLDFMRKNAQSWGVKLLFGLIVVVFTFWGVGSFRNNQGAILAKVNGEPIRIKEFKRAYDRTRQKMRNQQPNLDREKIRKMDLKNRVFNQLVSSRLLGQKAREWGLAVSPEELRKNIGQISAFQNEDKNFDPQRYKAVLKSNQLSPGQFEQNMAHNLLMQKVRSLVQTPARPDPEEVQDFYNYAQSKARAEYILFKWDSYKDQVDISEKSIKKYYQNNKKRFRIPERIKISYLKITPGSIADKESIPAEEIRTYYKQHKKDFHRPERVKARHILIETPKNPTEEDLKKARQRITKLRSRLDKGKDFAEMARQYSDGPSSAKGGDLGWFSRGDMVESFEKAAFSLETGKISEPVQTRFGLHLIKVQDRREEGTKPFTEVRDDIREKLARQKASDRLPDTIDTALEMLLDTGSLQKVSNNMDLKIQKSKPFTQSSGPSGLSLDKKNIKQLFSMPEGQITQTPIMLEDGYVLARVDKKLSPRPKKLDKVKPRIKSILIRKQAMSIARTEAESALHELKQSSGNLPGKYRERVRETEKFGRKGSIPGLGMNPDLVEKLFSAKKGKWLESPFQIQQGYILARAKEHIQPTKEEFQAQKKFWISTFARMERQKFLQAFIQQLREKAEIEVINPKILKY